MPAADIYMILYARRLSYVRIRRDRENKENKDGGNGRKPNMSAEQMTHLYGSEG
jgi:hypothetical protein